MERKKYSLADYNKKEAFEDATKFFIIYEGEVKEPKYFEAFNNSFLNPRTACILHVFEKDTGIVGSQPKKLIERAEAFIKNPPQNLKVTPSEEDKFRFVLDVDKHPDQFEDLKKYCDNLADANLYISNYCFEVWLWFHLEDHEKMTCKNSAEMKTELGKKHTEHKLKNYPKSYLEINRITNAIDRSEKADTNKDDFFPVEKSTKVYVLMKELLKYSIENKSVEEAEVI